MRVFRLIALLLTPVLGFADRLYTYVGDVGPRTAIVAWGSMDNLGNVIGRDSTPLGKAEVRVGGNRIPASRNWVSLTGLQPDTPYPYEVFVNGRRIGQGQFRTSPEKASKLAFFVIGDYGTGELPQHELAGQMWTEFERLDKTGNPVRFVLTTGDNVYNTRMIGMIAAKTGDEDHHWEPKVFQPYQKILERVPFYPVLGNHDGNETEHQGDLAVYLDNFFFPGGKPARYYRFSYGGLADFFALDSTSNTLTGSASPAYSEDGEQFRWLKQELTASKAPWKIAYVHHPPFNAGPGHDSSFDNLKHFVHLFAQSGVKAVFSGHEHNFQVSEQNEKTGGVRYVITGAGGQLRTGDVTGKMKQANIAGWAAERHFLVVEIEGRTMKITPVSTRPMVVKDANGSSVPMPLVVTLN